MNSNPYSTTGLIELANVDRILCVQVSEPSLIGRILARTVWWTGRQPVLTQLIYHYLGQYSAQIIEAEDADIVDEVVRQKIIKRWQNNDAAEHLSAIEQVLLSFENQDTLLILYLQVLSRGGLSIYAQPHLQAEQDTLIRSGLVEIEGERLVVANSIYAEVFNETWLESVRPGLTRRVSVPDNLALGDTTPLKATEKQNSKQRISEQSVDRQKTSLKQVGIKVGVSAIGFALSGIALFMYFQAPQNSGAVADTISATPNALLTQPHPLQRYSLQTNEQPDDRVLFDTGLDHAANARWPLMIQSFCAIPQSSAYFASAEQQLRHWATLYPADLQQAHHAQLTTQKNTCQLIETAL